MSLLLVGSSQAVLTECPAHCHDCYEIIMNVSGEGTAEIGGITYPFSPGTIHVIPPHTPHRKTAPEGFRDLFLHADTLQRGDIPAKQAFEPETALFLADDVCHTMEKLMSILLDRYLFHSAPDDVTNTLFQTVLRLIEEWTQYEPDDPVIHELIHTITASYSNPEFQVTDALLGTGYSKDHIRRRFRRATGMTPGAYLKSVRLSYAKRLLAQRQTLHLSINEVALMCGYYDPSYFCRSFRRATGMSPSEYMRMEH